MIRCRICQSQGLHQFLSLGLMPLANAFLDEVQLLQEEPRYPLEVYFCLGCGLVQLGEVVPPHILFRDYPYMTGTSQTMGRHLTGLAQEAVERVSPSPGDLVVDIGSNEGTLLTHFAKHGMRVLGVEPASNIAQLARSRGISTVEEFFSQKTARQLRDQWGYARIIVGTNVFAHVDDLDDFLLGVDELLHPDGVLIIEVPYLVDMLEQLEFDTIYHEHLSYFALQPLKVLFERFGMSIVNVKRIPVHGGSLRIFVQRSQRALPSSVEDLLALEQDAGITDLQTYTRFARQVEELKRELMQLLHSLKEKDVRIVGYGAPAKGNTLLNYCNIGRDVIECIYDNTPFKQGRYTPGTHIPILPDSLFMERPVNYALLLAWNYEEEILKKEEGYMRGGGRFIIPLPRPRIVCSEGLSSQGQMRRSFLGGE